MLACRLEGIFLKKFPQDSFKIPSTLQLLFSINLKVKKITAATEFELTDLCLETNALSTGLLFSY